MSYFVTGTDTSVGKTLVSCALLHAFAAQGKRVVGFKPVAAGCDDHDQNDDVQKLRAVSNVMASYGQINPYCFFMPIAPHLAAHNSGTRIELARILTSYSELAGQADEVIIEGAGGLMVPLNEELNGADLVEALGVPVIIVVGMRLGCLNHALLTQQALRSYSPQCAGWVANVLDPAMPFLQQNIEALRERMTAPLLGIIPYQAEPNAQISASYLDLTPLFNVSGD
jgi:dethiobiotin synthetase